MIDTGQCLSAQERQTFRARRIRRESDPMVILIRKEIRQLINTPEENFSEIHREQIKKQKTKLFRLFRKY